MAGLSRAPLWGLVRSARAEHPDRQLQLVDVDAPPAEAALLAKLLSTAAEPELALRHGAVVAPRLVRAAGGAGALRTPAGAEDYRVAVTHPGRLDGVSLVAAPELLSEPLEPGRVRVSVRAAGMNFRDVLIALGEIESPGIGFEFAGVVEAVGADVTSVSVGDRVFGFGLGCFGTRAVTPAHLVAKFQRGCRLRRQRRCRCVSDGIVCAARPRASQGGRAGAGARGGGGRGDGRGAALPALRGRGVWHGERRQVAGAGKGRDWMRGTSRVRATQSFEKDIPVGNGWRGSGCRPQLADG